MVESRFGDVHDVVHRRRSQTSLSSSFFALGTDEINRAMVKRGKTTLECSDPASGSDGPTTSAVANPTR